jgi:hypothetical protein
MADDQVLRLWARGPEIEGAAWSRIGFEAQAMFIAGIVWSLDHGTEGFIPDEALPEVYVMAHEVAAIVARAAADDGDR